MPRYAVMAKKSTAILYNWMASLFGGWRLMPNVWRPSRFFTLAMFGFCAFDIVAWVYWLQGGSVHWATVALFGGLCVASQVMPVPLKDEYDYYCTDMFLAVMFVVAAQADAALVLVLVAGSYLLRALSMYGTILTGANMFAPTAALLVVSRFGSMQHASPIAQAAVVIVIFALLRLGEMIAFGAIVLLPGGVWTVSGSRKGRFAELMREQILGPEVVMQASAQASLAVLGVYAYSVAPVSILVLMVPFAVAWRSARQSVKLAEAEKRAQTDPLTGLWNRAKFFGRAEQELDLASRYGHGLALIMGDLDNFKRVNDTRGHLAGDHVLRATATAMQRVIDESLFPLARYGGEEFVIALPACGRDDVLSVAEKLRAEIESSLEEWGTSISLGVSYMQENDRLESLVDRADKALYSAKFAGKNRVHEWPNGASNGPSPIIGLRAKDDSAAA